MSYKNKKAVGVESKRYRKNTFVKNKPKNILGTIGVRFLTGPNLFKVYTYRINKKAKVHLGQEIVVPTPTGNAIAVVVEIHKTPQDNGPHEYKFVTGKVVPL